MLGIIFIIITIRVITSGGTTTLHATVHGAGAVGVFFLMLVIAGGDVRIGWITRVPAAAGAGSPRYALSIATSLVQ